MNIYEIKRRTEQTAPFFFTRKTLQFFGQTMKSFTVKKLSTTKYKISAKRKYGGYTERIFDTESNTLSHVT